MRYDTENYQVVVLTGNFVSTSNLRMFFLTVVGTFTLRAIRKKVENIGNAFSVYW